MKILSSVLAALLCCALFLTFSCGGKKETAGPRVLVMVTNAEFPPYEFIGTDGDFTGIDVEIMRTICDRLGWKLKIENISFDSIIPALISGKGDIGVAGMSITEER